MEAAQEEIPKPLDELTVRLYKFNPKVGRFVVLGASADQGFVLGYCIDRMRFERFLECAVLRCDVVREPARFAWTLRDEILDSYRTLNHVSLYAPGAMYISPRVLRDCHALIGPMAAGARDFVLDEETEGSCVKCKIRRNVFDGMCPACEVVYAGHLKAVAGEMEGDALFVTALEEASRRMMQDAKVGRLGEAC